MKTRKMLSHKLLVAELVSQLKFPVHAVRARAGEGGAGRGDGGAACRVPRSLPGPCAAGRPQETDREPHRCGSREEGERGGGGGVAAGVAHARCYALQTASIWSATRATHRSTCTWRETRARMPSCAWKTWRARRRRAGGAAKLPLRLRLLPHARITLGPSSLATNSREVLQPRGPIAGPRCPGLKRGGARHTSSASTRGVLHWRQGAGPGARCASHPPPRRAGTIATTATPT